MLTEQFLPDNVTPESVVLPEKPLKGWLLKKASDTGLSKQWKRRYFVVDKDKIYIYRKQEDKEVLEYIPLGKVNNVRPTLLLTLPAKKYVNCAFMINVDYQSHQILHYLLAETQELCRWWVEGLKLYKLKFGNKPIIPSPLDSLSSESPRLRNSLLTESPRFRNSSITRTDSNGSFVSFDSEEDYNRKDSEIEDSQGAELDAKKQEELMIKIAEGQDFIPNSIPGQPSPNISTNSFSSPQIVATEPVKPVTHTSEKPLEKPKEIVIPMPESITLSVTQKVNDDTKKHDLSEPLLSDFTRDKKNKKCCDYCTIL